MESDFVIKDRKIVLSEEFLKTLKAGKYVICISVNGVQTWMTLVIE